MASKRDRERDLARKAYERRMQRRADRAKRERVWAVVAIIVVLMVGVGLGSAFAAGALGGSHSPAAAATTPSTPAASASPSASASPTPTSAMVNGKCVYTKSGTASRKVSLPSPSVNTKTGYTATIATNRGNIVIKLANSQAPCTVNSFVSLARQKFFSNTHCHRLTTSGIFVLQCGDPTGTGTGGPGYVFYTENTASLKAVTVSGSTEALYPAGIVAMANSGSADSNGSQFFLVYKNTDLPPSYTPFGTITSGLNIIQNVAKAGSTNSNGTGDGAPKEKVQINSVTLKKT